MLWFNKKRQNQLAEQKALAHKVSQEIEIQKKNTSEVTAHTLEVVTGVHQLIKNNGFTIEIFGAAGGKR